VIELIAETAEDRWEVEALYDLCFAPGREALSSYRLRDDVPPVPGLSQVARDELGILAGAIRFWPVHIAPEGAESSEWSSALLLGPVAVHPTHQGEGLGGSLIRDSLAKAEESGWERCMLVGDAPYYRRFGFQQLTGVEMPPPTNPERILGLCLGGKDWPGTWEGVTGKVTRWQGGDLPASS